MRRHLASRWSGAIAAVLATALALPSLSNGLAIDDHLYRARVVADHWTFARSTAHLMTFANPDRPAERVQAVASGELSWWAAPGLRWEFMRPLPDALHHAEFAAFGRGGAAWMHLHSVLWLAALAAAVALLYRRLLGATWVAGLAAVLYAIDDGHAFAAGWLANRCALIGATFGVLGLVAHDRWCRDRWRWGAVLGPAAVAVALACSEEMIAIAGLLGGYALVLHDSTWRRRAAALAPYVALFIAWYAVRNALGYGNVGTGSYTDPATDPIAYAAQAAQRVPIYVHSLFGALPADLWEVYFGRQDLTWLMVVLGVAFGAIIVVSFARLVRTERPVRFFAVGGALSLLLICGAHPNDRHTLLVGICASGLVARFIAAWIDRERALLPRGAAVLAVFFLFIHAVAAPVLLPVRARLPGAIARGVDRIDALVPDDAALAPQDLVLVSAPFKYLCNYASVVRRSNGGVSPRRWRCLGVTPDSILVLRPDARTLVLRPARGYLRFFEDTNVRARRIPFRVGDQVELPDWTAVIREVTPDGRPWTVEFHFAVPLEDPSLRWLVWHDHAYRSFTPPPIGASTTIMPEAFAFGDLMQ